MTLHLRVLTAVERVKLAVSEWVYGWRDWSGANWYLTDDHHTPDFEVRHRSDSATRGDDWFDGFERSTGE